MKKVTYSITRCGKESTKFTGVGYVTDEDLVIAMVGKSGKPFLKVFEGVVKACHKSKYGYNGAYSEILTVEATDKHGAKSQTEVYANYFVWYNFLD